MEQQVTEYTISLTTHAVYGDIVDIIVWPQITQNSPEEQGIVYQSVLVNDSYWLEQDRTIPVRNTVPIYVLGNVGIGTTMPLEKLDIYGNVQVNGGVSITGNVLITGDIVPSACNLFNLGTSNFRFKDLFLSGNTIDLGGTLISRDETEGSGGGIKVTSETGEAVDTTVRNLFAQGNIGIGLSNPQARLDVDGGIQVAGHVIPAANLAFDLGSSGARFRDLYLSGNTLDLGGTLLKRHVTGPLMVMSEATQSMESIIGRHAYIEGTANACNVIISTNGTGTSLLVKQESQGQAIVDFQAVSDYQSSLKSVFLINNNGLVGIGTTLPQEACHVEGNALVNGTVISSNVSINTNGTGTSLVINQKGSEAIANFQRDGTSVMFVKQTGHVGINTALPAEAFHVEGSALVNGVIYASNIQITSGGEGMPLYVNQIGEHPIAEFQSMGSSVLLVKQTGRVGINTSLPAEALHVEGNVVASGTITASNLVILGDYVTLDTITSNTEQMVITNDGTGPALIVTQTGPEPIADFYDDGGVLALRIADGGSVGIGTTTPKQKLHVQGSIQCETQFFGNGINSVASPSFSWASDTNTGLYLPALDEIGVVTAATERVRVIADGNVGIGTTQPLQTLHVQGAIQAHTQVLGQPSDTVTTPSFSWATDTNTGLYLPVVDQIGIVTAGVERARVISNGNVGIGTVNPLGKLDVAGSIIATNIQIGTVTNAFMPRGGIIMWSGSIVTIPTGWAICDGANSTPDLRNRFIVGAGSTYAVAATGGATTVTLAVGNLPAHSHTGTTAAGGSHNHTGTTDTAGWHSHYQNVGANFGSGGPVYRIDFDADGSGGNQYGSGVQTDGAGSHTHTFTTSTITTHSHTFTTDNTGSGTSFGILPPYYAIAFIMKL